MVSLHLDLLEHLQYLSSAEGFKRIAPGLL